MFGLLGIVLLVVLAVWSWSYLKKKSASVLAKAMKPPWICLKSDMQREKLARKSTMKKSRI
jgi:hypothetical protein